MIGNGQRGSRPAEDDEVPDYGEDLADMNEDGLLDDLSSD